MARQKPLYYTAFNSLALFLLGVINSQRVTSFNDLLTISDVDIDKGSFYFTAGNLGYLAGSLVAGVIYGRVKVKSMVTALAMTASAVFTIITPACNSFLPMLAIHLLTSTSNSCFETIVNTEEVQAWDGNSESAMQFLSFCYSLGGVVGPLITEPFLALKTHNDTTEFVINTTVVSSESIYSNDTTDVVINTTDVSSESIYSNETADAFFLLSDLERDNINITSDDPDWYDHIDDVICGLTPCDDMGTNDTVSIEIDSNSALKLEYSFLIVSILVLLSSIPFYVTCVRFWSKKKEKVKMENSQVSDRTLSRVAYMTLMAIACAFYFFHSMAEDSFNQYIFFFVVTRLEWSKRHGAWLNSLYWGSSVVLKLALVFILRQGNPGILLLVSTLGMVVSTVLFSIAGQLHINILIWISTGVFAVSQSSVYAGEFSWVDANLVKLEGKETGALMMSSGLGAAIAPSVLGFLMKDWSLMTFPYTVVALCTVAAVLFSVKLFIVKPIVIRRYGPPRKVTSERVKAKEQQTQVEMLCNELK